MAVPYIESLSANELCHRKQAVQTSFTQLKNRFICLLEQLETDHCSQDQFSPKFKSTTTLDTDCSPSDSLNILKGSVFDKAVIYTATAEHHTKPGYGIGQNYWNSSINIMIYPQNPYIPALSVQFYMVVTDYIWFNLAIELIPMLLSQRSLSARDVSGLQKSLQFVFKKYAQLDLYDRALQAGQDYFLIPHRNVTRGCGGIFCEQLISTEKQGGWQRDFNLIHKLGKALAIAYPYFVESNIATAWSEEEKLEQLVFRGLCAEYNLACDTNVAFCLAKRPATNAALAVLPPVCYWP